MSETFRLNKYKTNLINLLSALGYILSVAYLWTLLQREAYTMNLICQKFISQKVEHKLLLLICNNDVQSPQLQPETARFHILKPQQNPTDNSQPPYRPASGRSILRHAGTWAGDDFDECLQSVHATCGTKFDYDLNPFE